MKRVHDPRTPDKPSAATPLQMALLRALAQDPDPRSTDAVIAELAALGAASAGVLADALHSPDFSVDSAAEMAERTRRYLEVILALVTPDPSAAKAA